MIAEISSLITTSKAAYDIAKGIISLKSDIDKNESISKILEVLLSVQTQALSVNAIAQKLQEEKYELAKKVMEFENWSKTELQYELKEITSGVFVYVYKKIKNSSEPIHWLCTNCYKDKRKSIIRLASGGSGSKKYHCPHCKDEFYIRHSSSSSYQPDRDGGPDSWMSA